MKAFAALDAPLLPASGKAAAWAMQTSDPYGHRPLVLDGAIVGDLVVGHHSTSFYSVRPDLRVLDARSFRSEAELMAAITALLAPVAAEPA
ncbi:MAG: hypothetical protein AB7O56_09685 [Bauldia sp.]